MKKRLVWFAGFLALCLVMAGCGKKEEPVEDIQAEVTPEPTEVPSDSKTLVEMEKTDKTEEKDSTESKIVGKKTETASKMTITNRVDGEISTLYIRPNGDEDWGDDLISSAFTMKKGEQAEYYFEKGAESALYDIRIGFAEEGRNECFFRKLPLNTISQIALCMEGSGEAGIPYAQYRTDEDKKTVSTLEEVKRRLGLLDDEEDQEEDDDSSQETYANDDENENQNPSEGSETGNETPSEGGGNDEPTEEPGEDPIDTEIALAENCIGKPLSTLIGACGEPSGTTYEDEPETGQTGYHYYNGFTVSTTIDEDGNEIVAGVW